MKRVKKKFCVKLILTICLILTLFNFIGEKNVYATGSKDDEVWGGVLLRPIMHLLTSIGDGIMDILHRTVLEQDTSIIKISGEKNVIAFLKTIFVALAVALTAVLFVLAASATSGLAAAALKVLAGGAFKFTMGSVTMGMLAGGGIVGYVVGVRLTEDMFPDDIYLPAYTLSAEEIFSNQINLFDVNFFNPKEDKIVIKTQESTQTKFRSWITIYTKEKDGSATLEASLDVLDNYSLMLGGTGNDENAEHYSHLINKVIHDKYQRTQCTIQQLLEEGENHTDSVNNKTAKDALMEIIEMTKKELEGYNISNAVTVWTGKLSTADKYYSPDYESAYISMSIAKPGPEGPEDPLDVVIMVKVQCFEGELETHTQSETLISTAKQLRDMVSKWYVILRDISILVLMVLLIYSGIRIVLGSTAGEKAKYKERLTDWLVAMCLIMVMHYIMVFSVTIVEKITELVTGLNDKHTNAAYIPLTQDQWNNAKELDWSAFGSTDIGNDANYNKEGVNGIFIKDSQAESKRAIVWQTNYIGLFRLQSQLENEGTAKWLGYSFCYLVLVLFTLFFAFSYIKRIVYMAFLTIISPMVAMTYPTDKISDNKAQAFDAWLKEYIFNLMIQPLHLLLYTILVSSAFDLVSTNVVYAIVAIGFMMPAEKLMRRFFGYEKAKTPGLLGGAAGAALAMSGLQGLLKHKPSGKGVESDKSKDQNNVKFIRKGSVDEMAGIAEKRVPTRGQGGAGSGGNDLNESEADDDLQLPDYVQKALEEHGIEPGRRWKV